jgi:hypothetical protein
MEKPNGERAPERRPAATPEPAKDQSLVPSLSRETWELLELRIWNSFSRKLWVILTSVLTVAAFLGLLGTDAWLKAKVDDGLKQQREEFDRIRKSYETRAEVQLLAAWQKFPTVATILQAGASGSTTRQDFATELAEIKRVFPELGSEDRRESPVGRLTELRRWSVHLQGMHAALNASRRDVFEGAKVNPNALAEYYEKRVYPDYLAVLEKGSESNLWTGRDPLHVNSLIPDARLELNFFLPNAYEAIFKK